MSVLGAVFIHMSQNQCAIHALDFNITTFANLNFNSLHEVLWSGLIQYQIGCIVVMDGKSNENAVWIADMT